MCLETNKGSECKQRKWMFVMETGGPVDGQEVIINRAYLITAKIREREREILYIYASYSSYRADSI